ncbi:MAG: PLDc N-terminal domain-containing protein [Planctomycetota bacterium]
MVELFFLIIPLMFFVIGVGGTILWIWMIVDCATNEPSEGNDKLIWILIIVLTHWIGALIYLLVRRPERIKQYGR